MLRADGPIRRIGGVRLGSFNSFSEYHSVAKNMSDAELAFLRRHSFREGESSTSAPTWDCSRSSSAADFPIADCLISNITRSVHSLVKPLNRAGQT